MAKQENAHMDDQLSEVVFSWQHPDYVLYHKDKWWYILSLVIVILAVAGSIWQKNYTFAAFLVMFYLVVLLYENRPPEPVDFIVTPVGIKSGEKFYYWRQIDHFYIVYKASGIKNLYIEFKNVLNGRLVIPLDGQNAIAVRDYLLRFISEDLEREAEPISEQLRRLLKL